MAERVAADATEQALIERARGSDRDAFERLAERHRGELMAYCYRLLGSVYDAEDAVQEALLRAWRRLETYRGDGAFRSWLYRIATNACLDALGRGSRRILPESYGPPTEEVGGAPDLEVPWLSPFPDSLLGQASETEASPEVWLERRESVQLAFLAAIQNLPPRQRAALVLREALDWRATEIADSLQTSVSAANSALQRARLTMKSLFPDGRPEALPDPDQEQLALLSRYVQAWESGDLAAFIALLKDDAILSMPPMPNWYRGRTAIGTFFAWAWGPEGPGPFRLLPTRANTQPAYGMYGLDPDGQMYRALGVQVLALKGRSIASLTGFIDPNLMRRFGLPEAVPAD